MARESGCRLLYLIGQLRAGGSERQLTYLLQAMDRRAHGAHVAVWNFAEEEPCVEALRRLGVPLHAAPRGAGRRDKLAWFRRLVKRLRPEVIHSYSFFTNFAAQVGALGSRRLAIGSKRTSFDADVRDAGTLLGRLSGRWPRVQIANNVAAAEAARQAGTWFAPRRLLVVRNGVDLERFRATPPPSTRPASIVGVGSLSGVKRWDRLVHCAATLAHRGLDFRIRVVGEGPSRPELERLARALGVETRVRFLGQADDVPALLATSAFLIHPADIEGCPNAVMEAMASARAVVATDAGDTPSLVEEGKTGFVVRRGDDVALAERVATLLADADLRRRMGAAGRRRAEQEFGLDRLVAETLAAYRAAGWECA